MPKYNVPDGHWDDPEPEEPPEDPHVYTDSHILSVNDERPEIEKYDGLQWWFLIDDGMITGIDLSHYCPGPSHTDPIGFRAWEDVPGRVQRVVLRELNAADASEVVDIEACAEVADREGI